MRRARILTAFGASAVIVFGSVLALTPAVASSSGTNSGTAATRPSGESFAPRSASSKRFKPIGRPTSTYTEKTCVVDLSEIPDFTIVNNLQACGETLTITPETEKLSVPITWGVWGSPPYTESATPNILWTLGATSLTLIWSHPSKMGGIEAEPDALDVHSMSAVFMKGSKVVGTITRDVDGNGGARLFAARMKRSFDSVKISSDVDFAIAQIRATGVAARPGSGHQPVG